jgi:hypothetical protein
MKNSRVCIVVLLCIIVCYSCHKDHAIPKPGGPQPQVKDIYVYGTLAGVSISFTDAVYYKNGTLTTLNKDRSYIYSLSSIAISGDNVYAGGSYSDFNHFFGYAIYWLNGVANNVAVASVMYPVTTEIVVSGGNVYTATFGISTADKTTPICTFNSNGVPRYTFHADVKQFITSGTDIYSYGDTLLKRDTIISNESFTFLTQYATYYKNGHSVNLVTLGNFGQSSAVTGMCISGNDIYACGTLYGSGSISKAVYWKNGVMVTLPASASASTSGIAVNGNDVYVAGTVAAGNLEPNQVQHYDEAVLWKNGAQTILANYPSDNSYTSNIVLVGNDVYVGGSSGPDTAVTVYWKNNVPVKYKLPAGTILEEGGILLVTK